MPEPSAELPIDQKIETRHSETHDIVLNLTAENQAAVHALADQFWSGLPPGWGSYDHDSTDKYFVNNQRNPSFFAKVKVGERDAKEVREKGIYKAGTNDPRPVKRAQNSIVNEILLSDKIKQILNTDEARSIASRNRFTQIEYAEPLIGVIDKATGVKTMVYPFVKGDETEEISTPLSRDLEKLFLLKGIVPYDIAAFQMLEGKKESSGKVFLLDAGNYYEGIESDQLKIIV